MPKSNATQRAVRRFAGDQSATIFVEAPGNKIFILDLALPVGIKIKSVTYKTLSGTVTVNVQKVSAAGATSSVSGLSALAVSSTQTTTAPTADGTGSLAAGERLQFTTSAGAAPVDLSVSVKYQVVSAGQ